MGSDEDVVRSSLIADLRTLIDNGNAGIVDWMVYFELLAPTHGKLTDISDKEEQHGLKKH